MRKRTVVITIVLALAFSSYWMGYSLGKEREAFYKELDVLAQAMAVVEKQYVEDTPAQDLVYGAVTGLLQSLDPYSQFLDPEEYKSLITETEGQFGGLGIEITMRDGVLTVVSPLEDTPAWKAGVKPGDIIIKIDEETTKGLSLNEAVKKLRGQEGTEITLTIWRDKTRELKEVKIVRGVIKFHDIKEALLVDESIGYVRLAEFRETTPGDLTKALQGLKKEGLQGLVLDMRNNPGGLLDSAIEVASQFLDDGAVIVSTRSRTQKEKVFGSVALKQKCLDIPMVVLINGGSASGSEIVAAALRENKRAILVGETTFGKASVQSIIPLSDGSALRLTTSKYYTPKGISIHEVGIAPDIVVEEQEAEDKKEDIFTEIDKKIEEKEEGFDYTKDYQIVRAVDLVKGLLVLKNN